MRTLCDRIERVAATDFTILIEGAFGPRPQPGFIEFSLPLPSTAATGGRGSGAGRDSDDGEVAGRTDARQGSHLVPYAGEAECGRCDLSKPVAIFADNPTLVQFDSCVVHLFQACASIDGGT